MQLSIDLLIIVLSNYSDDEGESMQGKRKAFILKKIKYNTQVLQLKF
jgi:hypothetical protein